jgi:hypothetical protein
MQSIKIQKIALLCIAGGLLNKSKTESIITDYFSLTDKETQNIFLIRSNDFYNNSFKSKN